MAERGRPTLYDESYPSKLIEYIATHEGEPFPTKAGFAALIGVCRDTLHEWSRATEEDDDGKAVLKYPEFSDAYKKIEAIQEKNLVSGALQGKLNPTFAIFFAKNNLGWTDKVSQEVSGPDGGSVKSDMKVTFVHADKKK